MASNKNLKKIPQEIQCLPFFYPEFKDSIQAAEFVKKHASEGKGIGCFLVRLSSKGDNLLTISVSISDGSIRHVNVGFELVRDTYKYYIVPELKFSTFGQLCKFYRDHRIGNQEKIDNVRLLNPIKKHTETSHEYATLGHVNSGGSGSSGPGASTDGMHVPQMSQMPFSPFNPDLQSPVQSRIDDNFTLKQRTDSQSSLDSQGIYRPWPETSSDEQGAAAASAISHVQKKLQLKSPGKTPAKLKANGILDRPPLPIPNCTKSDVYYSSPKENINKIEHLRKILKSTEVCDCGIMLIDCELPHNYTVHRSHDESSKNRLFYQNAKGETTWNFPPHLLLDLTERQRQTIVRLSTENGMDPPKILFNPDYNKAIMALLERKRSQDSGQTIPQQQPTGFHLPITQPQFDLATQVVPPGHQQLNLASGGSKGLQGPSPTQLESLSSFQNQHKANLHGQQQYLSSTPQTYASTNPSVVYSSQSREQTQVGNGFHFEPEQDPGEGNKQTFPKLPQKK